ncbi:C-type lectin domain family 9 member A-like isoform X4 [Dermochelys coriacea]|uniref:C-type lectin domain family 9 member A-like isoform X4 n=1 Tax=Dermochelys coriacea TaxID=27794 RepID=UPI0018E78194|nr:C-type lectin domain family 9 member A-like isoform X4 [Dermochelys coriacea]
MTEEITYADLEFNKLYALENVPKPVALEEKVFQVTNIFQEENIKLKEKEKALQTNFSSRLQEIRESLCLEGELKNKNNGMSCTLCPTNWQRMGGDTCYYISSGKKTWEGSRKFCVSQNSTLLMIKDKEKLENIDRYCIRGHYWIGLSRQNTERPGLFWEDTTPLSTSEKKIFVYSSTNLCAYLQDKYIYADQSCNEKNLWICEKAPVELWLTDNQ